MGTTLLVNAPHLIRPASACLHHSLKAMPTERHMRTQQSEIWRDVVKQENKNAAMWERNYGPGEDRFRPDTSASRPATGASRPSTGASGGSYQSTVSSAKPTKAEKKAKLLEMKASVMASLNEVEYALEAERKAKGCIR